MRLSVIIPLFNCETVIERCLESIDHVEDMEIIVIDDGSTDKGASVVERYATSHPWVRVISKENGGASSARNIGIDNASGDYLMFVDADDYLIPGGLETLLTLAKRENADVLKYKILSTSKIASHDTTPIMDFPLQKIILRGKGKVLESSSVSDYHVVDALFKRQLIADHHIRLHEDLYLHEDDVFMAEVFVNADCVVSTDMPLYRYVSDSAQSHTHRPTPERARKIVDSALLAVRYRLEATSQLRNPQVDRLERVKLMRFVYLCSRHMLSSDYSFKEYRQTLNKFREYGCYPVSREWLEESYVVTTKTLFKNYLCNHPWMAWIVYKHRL